MTGNNIILQFNLLYVYKDHASLEKIHTNNNGQGLGVARAWLGGVVLVGVAYKYLRWSWVLK